MPSNSLGTLKFDSAIVDSIEINLTANLAHKKITPVLHPGVIIKVRDRY
jgi:hypothetical protein